MKVEVSSAFPVFEPITITLESEEDFMELVRTVKTGEGSLALFSHLYRIAYKRGLSIP